MIRDPSDGSVRELCENPTSPEIAASNQNVELSGISGQLDSGLPFGSTNPELIARLERSRAMLESYRKTGLFHRTTTAASTAGRSSETEE